MAKDVEADGVSGELAVAADGAKVKGAASTAALRAIGSGVAWLFSRKHARSTINAAMSERVAEKMRLGQNLDELESDFVRYVFKREAVKFERAMAVVERVEEVSAEVEERVHELPSGDPKSSAFFDRAQDLAETISDENVRDMFARVLAGERAKPGNFSPRVLEVVTSLDQEAARAFEILRPRLWADEYVHAEGFMADYLSRVGFTVGDRTALEDSGLVSFSGTMGAKYRLQEDWIELRIGRHRVRWRSAGMAGIVDEVLAVRLTRVGVQLHRVLPVVSDEEHFKASLFWLARKFWQRGEIQFWNGADWVTTDSNKVLAEHATSLEWIGKTAF